MGGTGGGSGGYTPPGEVLAAVRGAVASHQTIFLTFHAIHSLADDPPGYPLRLFRQIARGIKRSGISVMTLSQLDLSNGIPVSNHVYLRLGARSQITVRVLLRVGPTG
jgi:hypothetical protein